MSARDPTERAAELLAAMRARIRQAAAATGRAKVHQKRMEEEISLSEEHLRAVDELDRETQAVLAEVIGDTSEK